MAAAALPGFVKPVETVCPYCGIQLDVALLAAGPDADVGGALRVGPAEGAWNIDALGCRRVSAFAYGPTGLYLRPLTPAEQDMVAASPVVAATMAALLVEGSALGAVVRMRSGQGWTW